MSSDNELTLFCKTRKMRTYENMCISFISLLRYVYSYQYIFNVIVYFPLNYIYKHDLTVNTQCKNISI